MRRKRRVSSRLVEATVSRYDFDAPRLFVSTDLQQGAEAALDRQQTNYLANVLRLEAGDSVLIFNGRDGEWRARLGGSRKAATLVAQEQTRPQTESPDLDYLFAPLKHARLDYMVQKATEMGVRRLVPVITRRTQAARVNVDRMRANAIEAAEQCGILAVPDVAEPVKLEKALADWPADRLLIFCDEDAPVQDPIAALRMRAGAAKLALLIGPEGGFDESERRLVSGAPGALAISLGPRILRADTAAIAALALVQAALGDFSV
jgi:16S rRNA (uracil1498-N3)-methyltransferase